MLSSIRLQPKFSANLPPIETYAKEAENPKGPKAFLKLYQATDPNLPHPWLFIHRQNGYKGINILPIVEDEKGDQFVHLIKMKRPPLGGKITLELPAGIVGDNDQNEKALTAAKRELAEETGYDIKKIQLLAENDIPYLPGMATELNQYAIALAKDTGKQPKFDNCEKQIIVGKLKLPLSVFADHQKFTQWLKQMDKEGYLIGPNILLSRALMPPVKNNKLDLKA